MHFVAMTDTIVCFIQWNQSQKTEQNMPSPRIMFPEMNIANYLFLLIFPKNNSEKIMNNNIQLTDAYKLIDYLIVYFLPKSYQMWNRPKRTLFN